MTEKVKHFKNLLIQPKSLILIFSLTAIIVVSSAIIELNQSKSEMMELMEKQGRSILETVLKSSDNALLSYNKIEDEIEQRLLNNANTVKLLYEKKMINNALLERLAKENNVYRINVFDRTGKKIYSSHKDIHNLQDEKENPLKYIQPIFDGEADTLIMGIKPARYLVKQRFAVALATNDRKAIVLNIDAEELMKFRTKVGFGVLLKKVTENPELVYAVLQDEKGIIAGSGNINELKSIDQETILQNSLKENSYKWRIIKSGNMEAFEVLHPFIYDNKIVGIFRLGLSLAPINTINDRLTRRILIIAILLFIFGFVTITLVFLRQNYNILSQRYSVMESYSTRILDNVSDGIIVLDSGKKIKMLNRAAELILSTSDAEAKGKLFNYFFSSIQCEELLSSQAQIKEVECSINGKEKIFLFSISNFVGENNSENHILVFRDLTEMKRLEKQIQRNNKIVAMGEFSSSIAHEIRNPLNSIGTIAQQIGKDFVVNENGEEFKNLTGVVYKEVRRINDIVETFLKFGRPQPIKAEEFHLNDFLSDIKKQYSPHLSKHKIDLSFQLGYDGNVMWDARQMKQVFINLIENAIDSQPNGGKIVIKTFQYNQNNIEISVADSGIGINPEELNKIFDLYFTTKGKGNGIGLSIVHKIITEHGGVISVQSIIDEGTTFAIKLPLQYT